MTLPPPSGGMALIYPPEGGACQGLFVVAFAMTALVRRFVVVTLGWGIGRRSLKKSSGTVSGMPFIDVQAIIPYFTNVPEDVITNIWHFESGGPLDSALATTLTTRIETFYETVYGFPNAAANHVNWAAATTKSYDLSDPIPRVPIIKPMVINVTTPVASNIPTEVACVMSYHAAPVSGVPQARLRGRIYLGGLGPVCVTAGTTSTFPILGGGLRGAIQTAAQALLAQNDGVAEWVQRSRASGLITSSTITGGWIDNTPDTQRRRGVKATTRTLW